MELLFSYSCFHSYKSLSQTFAEFMKMLLLKMSQSILSSNWCWLCYFRCFASNVTKISHQLRCLRTAPWSLSYKNANNAVALLGPVSPWYLVDTLLEISCWALQLLPVDLPLVKSYCCLDTWVCHATKREHSLFIIKIFSSQLYWLIGICIRKILLTAWDPYRT